MPLKLVETSRKPSPIMRPLGVRPPIGKHPTGTVKTSVELSPYNLSSGIWGPEFLPNEDLENQDYWSPFSPSGLDTIHDNFLLAQQKANTTPNIALEDPYGPGELDLLSYLGFDDSFSRFNNSWDLGSSSTNFSVPSERVPEADAVVIPPGLSKEKGRRGGTVPPPGLLEARTKNRGKPLYTTVASTKRPTRFAREGNKNDRFSRSTVSRFARPVQYKPTPRNTELKIPVVVCSTEASRVVFLGNLGGNTCEKHVRELLRDGHDLPVVVRNLPRLPRTHAFIEFPTLSKAMKFKARVNNQATLGSDRLRVEIQNRRASKATTVYFSNINNDTSKCDILEDLTSFESLSHATASPGDLLPPTHTPEWDLLPIRITRVKMTSVVYVDFPSENDAKQAVRKFNGCNCFKSKCVRAELENNKRQSAGPTELKVEQIYSLVKQRKEGIRMADFESEFRKYYKEGNVSSIPSGQHLLKFLVKMQNLLLINSLSGDDVVIFFTEKTAFRSVLDIMHGHPPEGISVSTFKADLEKSLGSCLDHCNVIDFLKRWRVVSIVTKDGCPYDGSQRESQLHVKLAPMGSCTVYLGHLDQNTDTAAIIDGLRKVNVEWAKVPVRLNHSKGMVNAFVDMPSFADAEACIRAFNKKRAFGSMCVRAEMENSTAQRAPSRTATPSSTPRGPVSSGPVSSSTSPAISPTTDGLETPQTGERKKFSWSKIVAKSPATSGRPSLNIPSPKRDSSGSSRSTRCNYENIYKLLENNKGGMRLPDLQRRYKRAFGTELKSLKLLVRNERLLLLNLKGAKSKDDVVVFMTETPAYRLVVDTIKSTDQMNPQVFTKRLEAKLNIDLSMCDTEDFLRRWRFVTVKEQSGGKKIFFTPNSGSTVFFGNLNKETTADDIYQGLARANSSWRAASVRLKTGKAGFNYAFVDFKTYQDAEKAVEMFDGKSAFKSKYVSADIEQAVEQKKGAPQYTIFIGNLPSTVTKTAIQKAVAEIDSSWADNPVRLNLRNGWSHAFIDFDRLCDANEAILYLNGATRLGSTRLRVELSKNGL